MGHSGPSLGMGVTVLLQRPVQNIGGLGAWQPKKTQKDNRFLWETREVWFTGGGVVGAEVGAERTRPWGSSPSEFKEHSGWYWLAL